MRILYFTRDYTTHDRRFLTALAGTEHQVYYLRLERRGHQLEDRPLPPQITLVPWEGGRRPVTRWDGPRLLAGLKRVIHEVQPDLVQAGPLQSAALLAALAGFRPLLSMSWGYDLLVDAHRGPLWRWATRYTLRHSAVMVGDCDTIRQQARAFGMPDERIITFPWGADLQHFRPEAPGTYQASPEGFTLLSTRGWEPIYGVEVIARAFTQAARQRPELRLMMLGNGSQAGLLRNIFSQGDVAERVVFPGQVSQADLPRYYRSADLYISASHSDGTSISLLEAMACGRPVLLSDIPGNQEWIARGEQEHAPFGWCFPDGDANALSQAILNAVEQRACLPEMGRAARQVAERYADWEQNFPHLFQAYALAQQYR